MEEVFNAVWPLLLTGLTAGLTWVLKKAAAAMDASEKVNIMKKVREAIDAIVLAVERSEIAGTEKKALAVKQATAALTAMGAKAIERAGGRSVAEIVDTEIEAAVTKNKLIEGVALSAPLKPSASGNAPAPS